MSREDGDGIETGWTRLHLVRCGTFALIRTEAGPRVSACVGAEARVHRHFNTFPERL